MSERLPSEVGDDGDRGWELAEHLLRRSRQFEPLSPFAHERLKSRLGASLPGRSRGYRPWLRPLVAALVLLCSATASGIAWKRLATPPPPDGDSAPALDSRHPVGRGKGGKSLGGKRAPTQVPPLAPPVSPMEAEPPKPIPGEVVENTAASTPGLPVVTGPRKPAAAKLAEDPLTGPAISTSATRLNQAEPRRLALATERLGETTLPVTAPSAPGDEPQPAIAPPAQPPGNLPWNEPPVAPSPPIPDARQTKEEQLLTTAVRALRMARDPSAALAALDEYQAQHRQGRLSVEASVLRAEALTALGRKAEALQGLDELDLGRVPGAVRRRLERGELRESIGRWSKALADFDWVLAHAQDADLLEAAMAGRMRCRHRMGDASGARGDAAEYLRLYPRGRSRQQASEMAGTDSKR